jgi:hypothetical protein
MKYNVRCIVLCSNHREAYDVGLHTRCPHLKVQDYVGRPCGGLYRRQLRANRVSLLIGHWWGGLDYSIYEVSDYSLFFAVVRTR